MTNKMHDLIRKLEIIVSLPAEYSKQFRYINNDTLELNVALIDNELILHEVYIVPEKRGKGYWTNFVLLLEHFVMSKNIRLKIQSILNKKFMESLLKRDKWKKYPQELSAMFAYK